MIDQPKEIEVPGIPTKLREQTLAEYVQAIADRNHLVHRELRELQMGYTKSKQLEEENGKLRGMLSTLQDQLALHAAKIDELQAKLSTPAVSAVEPVVSSPAPAPAETVYSKMPCPHCGQKVSTYPNAWKSHMSAKHNAPETPIPV